VRMAKKSKTAPTTEKIEQKNGEHEPEVKQGEALAVRERESLVEWTPRFAMTVDQAVELEQQKQEFMQRVLKEGFHYGKIPGAGDRKVLFKAGAEALCAAMRLHPELSDAEPPVVDETGELHGGEPYWSFRRTCRMYVQTGPGPDDRMLVAQAEGSCNSFEIKYRYRDTQRTCPDCGKAAIRQARPAKDKPDQKNLGFYCWKKIGGCGANFQWNEQRIITQKVGREKNKDVMDTANTGLKMADKRALVATTLIATGFSTDFTQDLEDKVLDGDGYVGEPDGPDAGDTQSSASVDRQAAPAPKASGSAQTASAPPKVEVDPETKTKQQVVVALGNSLDPPWAPANYAEGWEAMGKDYRLLIGTLVELHMICHGANCAHITAVPSSIDYVYTTEGAQRAWVNKMAEKLTKPAGQDVDPDDIPF